MTQPLRVSFSQWHPSDHRILSPRCRSLYGGWRRHLWIAWNFGPYRDNLKRPFYKHLLCKLGKHDVRVGYAREDVSDTWHAKPMCSYCFFTRPPTQEEIDYGYTMPDFSNAVFTDLPGDDV